MFTYSHGTIQVVVPEHRYRDLIAAWYDDLEPTSAKAAITRIKWSELRPPQDYFNLHVLCTHPHPEEIARLIEAKKGEDSDAIWEAAEEILGRHSEWITDNDMPKEATIDGRSADVSWMPAEIPYYDPDDLPAQVRGQIELNRQATKSLCLVVAVTQSIEELVKTNVGSNIPFFSAGYLSTGISRPRRRFTDGFPETEDEKERFQERVMENPGDYVALMRLAGHFGCTLPLVTLTEGILEEFRRSQGEYIPEWLGHYQRTEEEDYDFLGEAPLLTTEQYSSLEEAGETLRLALIAQTVGREPEIADMINFALADLPVPDGPFKQRLDDGADWWKTD